MRHLIRAAVGLLLLLAVGITPALGKTYSAERFDSRIRVLADGALEVTETVVFTFESGTFEHVFREIPARRTDGIEVVRASMDGRILPFGDDVNQAEVSGRSKVRVRWRFHPVADSTHTFVLTYIARGVVFQEGDSDVLEWRALPREHQYRIASSTVEVVLPPALSAQQDDELRKQPVRTHRVDGGTETSVERSERDRPDGLVIRISGRSIRANGWMEVRIPASRGALAPSAPQWQVDQLAIHERAPLWVTAAGLVFGAGIIILIGLRQRYDAPAQEVATLTPSGVAPSALAPGLVGPLLANGRVRLEHAMATLFSLADRGVVSIQEQPQGFFGQRSFHVRRRRSPGPLAPHEAELLAIGAQDAAPEGETPLSTFRGRVVRRFTRLTTAVEKDLLAAGLIDPDRAGVRKRYVGLAVMLFIAAAVGCAAAAFLVRQHGGWPFLVPAALTLTGVTGLIFAASITPLSNEGLRQAERWRAYRNHLKSVARNRDQPASSGREAILPIVIAAGLASEWAKYVKRHPGAVPSWFRALSADSGGPAFAAFVTAGGEGASGGGASGSGGGGAAGGGSSGAG